MSLLRRKQAQGILRGDRRAGQQLSLAPHARGGAELPGGHRGPDSLHRMRVHFQRRVRSLAAGVLGEVRPDTGILRDVQPLAPQPGGEAGAAVRASRAQDHRDRLRQGRVPQPAVLARGERWRGLRPRLRAEPGARGGGRRHGPVRPGLLFREVRGRSRATSCAAR